MFNFNNIKVKKYTDTYINLTSYGRDIISIYILINKREVQWNSYCVHTWNVDTWYFFRFFGLFALPFSPLLLLSRVLLSNVFRSCRCARAIRYIRYLSFISSFFSFASSFISFVFILLPSSVQFPSFFSSLCFVLHFTSHESRCYFFSCYACLVLCFVFLLLYWLSYFCFFTNFPALFLVPFYFVFSSLLLYIFFFDFVCCQWLHFCIDFVCFRW